MDTKRLNLFQYLSTAWWVLQGIFLMCIASFTELIYVELLVILFSILRNCKKKVIRILAHIGLIIYMVIASITIFMVITVASPTQVGLAYLLIIGVFNIIFSIYDIGKLLFYIYTSNPQLRAYMIQKRK